MTVGDGDGKGDSYSYPRMLTAIPAKQATALGYPGERTRRVG